MPGQLALAAMRKLFVR